MPALIGVGVGPGDPEMVTVKALRVLREADVLLVPVMAADEPGRAESIVRPYVPAERIRRVVFALNERGGLTQRRTAAWEGAASTVAEALDGGAGTVAFATIGDPNLYSTFTYLARTVQERRPEVSIDTVPGITAMQDLAMRSGTVLAEGSESLTLLPLADGTDRLAGALETSDTVVAYKCGSRMPAVLRALAESERLDGAVYGAALGLAAEDIHPAAELDPEHPAAYLSTVIAPRMRPVRGGKLE